MKKYAILLVLMSCFGFAQDLQQHIATLKKELKSNPNLERTTQIFSDLTWDYIDVSLDSALVYGEKALLFAQKTKKHQLISQCYSNLGGVYLRKENFKKSEESYQKAIQIRTANKDFEGVAKAKINIGNVFASKQDYVPATKYFIQAIQYFEGKNDTIVSLTKGNLGLIFFEMKNYAKAIKYLEESTDFLKKNDMKQGLCHTYLSLGDVYLDKKDTLKALNSYKTSLENCKSCKDNLGISTLNQRIGAVHSAKGNSESAKKYYQISEKLLKELNSEIEQTNVLLSKSEDFIQQKKYREAYKILLQVKKIHKEYESDRYLLETYKKLTLVCLYQEMKDSSAFYFNQYTNLKEEKLKASVLEQTAELETKYQTAEKEKQLLQKEAEAKKKTTTIIILSLLAFFIAIVGFLIYRQQRLKNVQQKQEFELQSAIAQIENQNKLHEQRLAISRDLHDNIGAQLTFIISSVENLKFGFPTIENSIKNHLTKISDFTKTTIVELRDTIWAMNANEFTFDDLSSRIYNFIEKAQSAKENTAFKFLVDDSLKNSKFSSLEGVNLYRTIQEAVNNAIKYADATEVSVQVQPNENGIVIDISDNGKGFDLETIDFGNGIVNMQKRIEEIGGVFKIQSELTKGTQITISLNK
ncbi:tetratricopeptide repeat protein [Flavobacterium lacisediminis]|uniref:histidine kinase n=1 Tax=Flavobacterium lacisediminis TaxID=2989705 RepID=A0ABT3EFJ8_9FLAO|nr:tetratricopeptide repeat protein [Flavobacterium lacisediminis]MCW1147357.1 tetratricopeptide repeat protein [Flavobacterium lacisediminis]